MKLAIWQRSEAENALTETKIKTLAIWAQKTVLPNGYRELDYIETDGTQYITTGVTVTGNTRVVAKMMLFEKGSAGNYVYMFASATPLFCVRMHWNNGRPYCRYGNETSQIFYVTGVGEVLSINYGGGISTISDPADSYSKDVGTVDFTDGELQIFAAKGGSRGKGRVWMFKVYDGEALVRDYIPCINPDGEVGLYDLITASFYGNARTGSFIAGKPIETKIKNIKIGGNA